MLKELSQEPDSGFLGFSDLWRYSAGNRHNTGSFEQLEAYARDRHASLPSLEDFQPESTQQWRCRHLA